MPSQPLTFLRFTAEIPRWKINFFFFFWCFSHTESLGSASDQAEVNILKSVLHHFSNSIQLTCNKCVGATQR